jgi:hypothetical protein
MVADTPADARAAMKRKERQETLRTKPSSTVKAGRCPSEIPKGNCNFSEVAVD